MNKFALLLALSLVGCWAFPSGAEARQTLCTQYPDNTRANCKCPKYRFTFKRSWSRVQIPGSSINSIKHGSKKSVRAWVKRKLKAHVKRVCQKWSYKTFGSVRNCKFRGGTKWKRLWTKYVKIWHKGTYTATVVLKRYRQPWGPHKGAYYCPIPHKNSSWKWSRVR